MSGTWPQWLGAEVVPQRNPSPSGCSVIANLKNHIIPLDHPCSGRSEKQPAEIGTIPGSRVLRAPCISGTPRNLSRAPEPSIPPVIVLNWLEALSGWSKSGALRQWLNIQARDRVGHSGWRANGAPPPHTASFSCFDAFGLRCRRVSAVPRDFWLGSWRGTLIAAGM